VVVVETAEAVDTAIAAAAAEAVVVVTTKDGKRHS
jgi:hypothetical protein